MQIEKYAFQKHGDERGHLVVMEELKDIPFKIKRVYYMFDTNAGFHRGKHAHKELEQILVCVHGSCKIVLDDGRDKKEVELNNPYEGLYVGANIWREMFDFKDEAVLMCFASELYDENDYIRDYNEFIEYLKQKSN